MLDVNDITPCLMVCNEDYWIYYTLRDLVKVFPKVIVLDTGSDDGTKSIIKSMNTGRVQLIEESYGHEPNKIGNGRNILRELCQTHWMFLVDGDEIWREDKLRNLLDYTVPDGVEVVMVAGWNVEDDNGKLKLRTNDLANRDGLFTPVVKWYALEYPFESYGLSHTFPMSKVSYTASNKVYAWHMRHTLRSSRNDAVYFRREKLGYYPYNGVYEDMPTDWIGEINTEYYNPYLI